MRESLPLLPGFLVAHLQLVLVALAVGFAASVPLGVWVARRARFEAAETPSGTPPRRFRASRCSR